MLTTVESLCSMDGTKAEKMFLLGDTIYVQTVGAYSTLIAIDRSNLRIDEVPVQYHDINWNDLNVTAAIQVYNGVAYKWTEAGMAAGRMEANGCLHWRIVETTGAIHRLANFISTGVQDGDTTKYVLLMQETPETNEFFVYELNLQTRKWKRSTVSDTECLAKWRFSDAALYLVATSSKLHVYRKVVEPERVIIDRSTNSCAPSKFHSAPKVYDCLPAFGPSFVAQNKLYSIVFHCDGATKMLNLFRFDEEKDAWSRVGKRRVLEPFDARCSEVLVDNSRIYILTNTSSIPIVGRLMFMFVIDLDPTLFDWAVTAARRCGTVRQQAPSLLPQDMVAQVCRLSSGDAFTPWPGFRADQVHFKDHSGYFPIDDSDSDDGNRKRSRVEPVALEGQRSLKTSSGKYLRAWQGSSGHRELYVDLAPHCRACEKWSIEKRQGGKVVLKSIHKHFLSALSSGHVGLAEQAGVTEQWEPIENEDGSWSFKSALGTWLSTFQANEIVSTMPCKGKTEEFWLGSC